MMKNRKFHYAARIISILLALCMAMAILPTTVFAGNGPNNGEYSFAWVHLCALDEEGLIDDLHNIWSRDGEDIETVKGISYSEATNTLTLTDVNMPDYFIVTNEMGDDFKIELKGDNRLLYLYAYGYGWGGSVELTGNGRLTLNEKKTAECPITLEAEYSDAVFVADSTVALTVYKSSSDSNIVENITTKRPENAIQFNGKTDDAGITSEEIQKYKTLPVMCGVSDYDRTFDGYYTKDGKKYAISESHHVDDNGEFTDTFWAVYALLEVDHPSVPTGKIAVDLWEELYEAPETQGYTKHEGELSANAPGNCSSHTDIVKNTATGKEYAYVVDWAENTYTLYELVTELDGFDNGWGEGNIWYATPAEPTVTGSADDDLPDGYEYISLGGSGFYLHTATGGSGDVFTQTPSGTTPPSNTVTELDDSDSGVKVKFTNGLAEGSELRITPSETEETDIDNLLAVYNISVYQNGAVVPISNNKMEINIPLSDELQGYKYYQVAYLENGEVKERFNATLSGDTLKFVTNHLSEYAVLGSDTPFASITQYGDANEDGKINMLDVLLIRKYIAKQPVTPNLIASDVTDDGKINMLDVLLIRKFIAKQPVILGPQK